MVKTKLVNLEEREKHREVKMEEIRRILFEQQALTKRLLTELNEMKNATLLTLKEIEEVTDTTRYATIS